MKRNINRKGRRGRGFLNSAINKLPFELHIPGYQYCGPGTKLEKRLSRGDSGINPLDKACKEHDKAYNKNKDLASRHQADRILAERAWERVKDPKSTFGERAAAWLVTTGMKAKMKLGSGLKRRKRNTKTSFRKLIEAARLKRYGDLGRASKRAYSKARKFLRNADFPKPPRILPIPKKIGGFLPFLVPIMAGLSAIGSLAGGAAGIAKAVNEAKDAKMKLDELKRHNQVLEAQRIGSGLYLQPYRKGYGLLIENNIATPSHRRKRLF